MRIIYFHYSLFFYYIIDSLRNLNNYVFFILEFNFNNISPFNSNTYTVYNDEL